MQQFEYKVVPAPDKGTKVKGLKSPAERYARSVSDLMNQLAQDGWEYWRAEVLPSEERKGLTGSVTVFHNLLVFRRPSAEVLAQAAQGRLAAPAPTPVLAAALSAGGDGWGVKSASASAPPPVAAAPLSPHAPEGRAPSLSAQRGWPDEMPAAPAPQPSDASTQSDAQGWTYHGADDQNAARPRDADTENYRSAATADPVPEHEPELRPEHGPEAVPESGEDFENLFYTDSDDDRPHDRLHDAPHDRDEASDDASDPDDRNRR